MKRPFLLLAVAALAGAVGACDDKSTRPVLETSTVNVRAYVDANGSGTFDAGDVALASTPVTLTHSNGTTLTATTDNAGLAVFTEVQPGSYRAALTGSVPQGAVLATATSPVVAVPSFGDELSTEFRYVLNPGSVAGTLFRDDNEDGVFDDGDTPAPGIPVAIFAGSSASGDPIAETVTDPDGGFSFSGLRPGSYTLSFTPFPTMTLVGGNTQSVTVEAEGMTASPVTFTGNLLSTIAEVRAATAAAEGTVMAVEGVVTWQPSFGDQVFIQDETGGILVDGRVVDASSLGLEPGDRVLVVGETDVNFGEVQLTRVSTLTVQSKGEAPEPLATSALEINAAAQGGEDLYQHRLVQIKGATVTEIEVLSFGNQFVTLTDPAGNEFGVYADSRTGVVADMWAVGNSYDVTGVPGYDNRFAYHNRIEVRGPEDVVPSEAPVTIAQARSTEPGTVVTVRGVVSWQPSFNDEVFIQDETGGILVFAAAVDVRDMGLVPGDTVLIVGETNLRFGEVQLTSVSSLIKQSSGEAPDPISTTALEINAPAQGGENMYQHRLVRIAGATVTDIEVLSFGNQFVTLTDLAGNEFGVYADARTGVAAEMWTVGGVYDVTGVPGYDNRFAYHNRIEVRGPEDVVIGEAPLTVAEARAAAAGTVVTVTGTVSWQPVGPTGSSFSDELFIQDATGGIQIYGRDADVRSLGLKPGDVVAVTGETEDRFGERQITKTSSITRIGEQAAPTPVAVTPAELAAGEQIHELVRIEDAVVVSVTAISFGNQLVTLRAPDGTEFGVYVDSRIGVVEGDWTVGETVDITGVVNYDSRYEPHSYRIWVRSAADIQAAG